MGGQIHARGTFPTIAVIREELDIVKLMYIDYTSDTINVSSPEDNPYLNGELLRALTKGTLVAIKTYPNAYVSPNASTTSWGISGGMSTNTWNVGYDYDSKERYAYGMRTIQQVYRHPGELHPLHDTTSTHETTVVSEDGAPLFGILMHDALYKEEDKVVGTHHWLQVLVDEKVLCFELGDLMLARDEEERKTAIEINQSTSFSFRNFR